MTKKPLIGQKIKQRREELGLTPTTFGKKIAITPSRIWELENTSTRPSADILFRVAEVLDVPILYFLTDCELNDVDEEILLVKYRKLSRDKKKLAIEIVKLLRTDS